MATKTTKHLTLSEATEDEIAEMQETGRVVVEEESETKTDAENRGSGKGKSKKEPAPPTEYSPADPAETLGRMIISQDYPELAHNIPKFIFTSDLGKSDNQPVIMKTLVKKGLDAWGWQCFVGGFAGEGDPFFIILISQSHWEQMPQKGREAMLDSHIARCGVRKNSGALYIAKPDVQEFVTVLNRRGFYTNKLKDAAQVVKKHLDQPELMEAS